MSYSAQAHGSHAEFQRSNDFEQYRNQVRENLSSITAFCRRHEMSDAQSIENYFDFFFRNRFGDHHYFDSRAELLDSVGKQSLDEFCAMIGNDAIDVETRKAAIRNLAQGMTSDADSVVSDLASAAGALAKATGGLRGKLWNLKEATIERILREAVRERFPSYRHNYNNEALFIRTAWNLLADQFGLKKIPQGNEARLVTQDRAFIEMCETKIVAALAPDRLSRQIAETCQARFNSEISTAPEQSSGIWDTDTANKAGQTLKEIAEGLGLATEDHLQFDDNKRDWILRQSDLRLKSFLKFEEEGPTDTRTYARPYGARIYASTYTPTSTPNYTLRTDPSLIALDILRTMSDMKLLGEHSYPHYQGGWIDKDGIRTAIFTFGDLACVARIPRDEIYQEPVWDTDSVEFELITLPDLLHWKETAGNDNRRQLLPATIRQIMHATDIGQLDETRKHWLKDVEGIYQLLRDVGTGEAKEYMMGNLAYLGGTYSNEQRTDLLARLMRMDMADIVWPLAGQWYSNASARIDAIYTVLLREAIPALHQAMRQEDAKAAVSDWYQPLRESGLLIMVAPRLAALLKGSYTQSPVLLDVLSVGHAAAVEAVFDVLKDLLKDPEVRSHIKDELPDLLAATDRYNRPALSDTLEGGYTAAAQAFYRGLRDLLTDPDLALSIRPPLLKALPELLAGQRGNSDSGLGYALESGNAGVLEALHDVLKDLLNDADIAPHIQRALPHLLAVQIDDKASALPYAMKAGSTAAMEAYFAILLDPGVMPIILHALPGMLTATDKYGTPGLSHALEHGHTGVIEALHAFLKHLLGEPAIAQTIQPILPELLAARNRDGSSGFSYARGNAHMAAIAAFETMLADPAIRPYIGDLPTRLSAEEAKRRPAAAASMEGDGPRLSDID